MKPTQCIECGCPSIALNCVCSEECKMHLPWLMSEVDIVQGQLQLAWAGMGLDPAGEVESLGRQIERLGTAVRSLAETQAEALRQADHEG